MRRSTQQALDFNIDRLLNPYIPPNPLKHLPQPIAYLFGHRTTPVKEPASLICYLSAFVGAFVGLIVAGAIYRYAPGVKELHPPVIIASLGASAILHYNAIRVPLAQPRNAIVGHTLSAIIGVAVSKLFQLHPDFANLEWIAGALACGLASMVMSATKTVHPPGGATAVLACTEMQIIVMGWWFVPVILLATCALIAVGLLSNNLMARQYPLYWWTPDEVGQKFQRRKEADEEKGVEKEAEADGEDGDSQSDTTLRHQRSHTDSEKSIDTIHIMPYNVSVPDSLKLTDAEAMLLDSLQLRLRRQGVSA